MLQMIGQRIRDWYILLIGVCAIAGGLAIASYQGAFENAATGRPEATVQESGHRQQPITHRTDDRSEKAQRPVANPTAGAGVSSPRRTADQLASQTPGAAQQATSLPNHAPPFRSLHLRYPVETLAEAFAEGITTGHPSMPEFRLDPGQINDVISYLKTLER